MSVESRRNFIHAIGGQQVVADHLGLKDRRVVDNWSRYGFSHTHKPALIEMANARNIEPHPELMEERQPKIRSYSTPLGQFIHAIAKNYGIIGLANKIGCPESSLRRMCERGGGIIPQYVPALEQIAKEVDVELPEDWQAARDLHHKWEQGDKKALAQGRRHAT